MNGVSLDVCGTYSSGGDGVSGCCEGGCVGEAGGGRCYKRRGPLLEGMLVCTGGVPVGVVCMYTLWRLDACCGGRAALESSAVVEAPCQLHDREVFG